MSLFRRYAAQNATVDVSRPHFRFDLELIRPAGYRHKTSAVNRVRSGKHQSQARNLLGDPNRQIAERLDAVYQFGLLDIDP